MHDVGVLLSIEVLKMQCEVNPGSAPELAYAGTSAEVLYFSVSLLIGFTKITCDKIFTNTNDTALRLFCKDNKTALLWLYKPN